MAYMLIPKGKMEEAMYLYKSSILVCMKTLGPNHVQTAHVHMDFAQFYLKWDKKDQALSHFEQAYIIYDTYFHQKLQQKNSVLTADAAMQVVNIMEEQNRLNEAYKYVSIASETYSVVYGNSSDNTIIALWLKLQIAYSQSKPKSQVVDMADQLFNSLVQRDQEMMRKNNEQVMESYDGYENVDELKGEMEKIKVLCIATHIMEMTRMLPEEKKRTL